MIVTLRSNLNMIVTLRSILNMIVTLRSDRNVKYYFEIEMLFKLLRSVSIIFWDRNVIKITPECFNHIQIKVSIIFWK